MEKELLLLRKLSSNPEITQREMAKATGLSLGRINAIIKELIKREIIRVDKINKKTMFYRLTSQGSRQKMELSYKYFVEAYSFLKQLDKKIDLIIQKSKRDNCMIVLFGDKDEISELLENKLNEEGIEFKSVFDLEEIGKLIELYKVLVVVWQPEKTDLVKVINCLKEDLLEDI